MAAKLEKSGAGHRALLMCDAFLFAAAIDIVVTSILIGLNVATGMLDQDLLNATVGAAIAQGGSLMISLAAVAGGAIIAWRLHGRKLDWGVGVAMILGVMVGVPLAFGVVGLLAFAVRSIPFDLGAGPPWVAIGLIVATVAAVLLVPLTDAIKDMRTAREHALLDQLRVASVLLIVLLAAVVMPAIASVVDPEIAEAGIFMVPFGAGGALAVLGADVAARYRERHTPTQPRPAA